MIPQLDFNTLGKLVAAFGEETVKRMITIPSAKNEAQAKRNHDDPAEFIAKRDAWVDATIAYAKEWANLDND